ncbi:wsc domain-containing [Trichoderma cornu-damae]|uniref:Wsc domain-containing n=1 Tax=Trichoderma cornu-damae TaxID=654480 RepID=A0A9P8QTD2_9HYPO|nr:wsc domain-containing [Trichoderma cornu-damae]
MDKKAIGTEATGIPSASHSAKQDFAVSSSTPSHTTDASTAASSIPEPSEMQTNETTEFNLSHGDPVQLLDALTDAVKAAIRESGQPLSTTPKHHQKSVLSDIIVGQSNAIPLSADPSLSLLLQTPRPGSLKHLPTPSVRLLGGFWGDSLTLRVHYVRAATSELPPASPDNSPSFLSDVARIVTEISGIDPVAAAKLTDTVLDALHVDSSAIASVIPKVASQASVSAADLLPLIIPAVSKAMNQPLPQEPSVSSLDMVETLNKVLQQGTAVINDLSRAMEDITDPALLAVLNQLAMIVSAVSSYLKKPLCAVDRVVDGTSFEAVVPCGSAETKSPSSAGQPTAPAATSLPESTLGTSGPAGPGGTTTIAPPSPYSPSTNPAPPSTSMAGNPSKTSSPAPTNDEGGGGGMPGSGVPAETSSAHPPCPTCPSCDQCPPKICSVKGQEGPGAHHPPDPSVGPCPGKGFRLVLRSEGNIGPNTSSKPGGRSFLQRDGETKHRQRGSSDEAP